MSDLKKLLIFFSQFDLTNNKIKEILDFLGDRLSIKGFKKSNIQKSKILKPDIASKMLDLADDSLVDTFVLNQAEKGIKVVCKFDDEYPQKLFDIYDSPYVLYYKGDLSLASQPSLSIVGTRKPTNYGRLVTERLVRDVASAGVVIISGLAYGIDSIAHKKCLEVNGKTIAVLGGGFDHIYPAEHESLADEIAQKGLLLSEYRPKRTATVYTFPTRNRIIAGLSDGVLITEAGFKSGTIHTKDFALDFGRNMYAVPGNIDSLTSSLTNDIIKRGQAKLVTDANDILEDYELPQKDGAVQLKMDFSHLTETEQNIIAYLKDGMKTVEEIIKNTQLSINILNTYLTTLEISGIIKRLPGGYFALDN